MKKSGIINAALAGELARLGHADLVMVCDAGLPIPPGPAVVDLAFQLGTPSFEAVLSGLLDELVLESAIGDEEARTRNPATHELLTGRFPDIKLVPHEELQRMVPSAKLVVRTGEATPYSNVILHCGVPF